MSESEADFGSQFADLDGLIQLIYQGSSKFVVLSAVDDYSWTVHMGLTGDEGRWWRGRWTEKDVHQFLGTKSTKLIEMFAEKLADTIVKGELNVGNWSAEPSGSINLVIGPGAKMPVSIPLVEMTSQEAAVYATKVFSGIALSAQSRKCSLNAPAYTSPATASIYRPNTSASSQTAQPEPRTPPRGSSGPLIERKKLTEAEAPSPGTELRYAKAEVMHLKTELARARTEQQTVGEKRPAHSSTNLLVSRAKGAGPAVRPPKGASLANPSKKARKYQAMEFEDDD